ncbi:MAG: inorganic phosphate transporter [Candidatus Sericytochromatia bacterium]|nr:inorganic phosphate transporter [Candidatus Sericytochromatia bacterium]
MPELLLLIAFVVFLALVFDFINGFHDTANAIAASVSTGVLTPRRAILMAAVLNFLGALAGTEVAKTIGKGIIDTKIIESGAVSGQWVVVAALVSAITWNLLTWWWGLPSSSSHAIIGGLIGSAVAGFGWAKLHWLGVERIFVFLVLSPLIGGLVAFSIMLLLMWVFRSALPSTVTNMFRPLQILAAGFMSFSHGTNDAQKAMGIITLALFSGGLLDPARGFEVPMWVKLAAASAMALGTSAGGWKIIKTMGTRIVKLQPINGFASDTAAALTITTASQFGLPVSTTHVVSGAIMGVGATKRVSAVRWGVAGNMVLAWVFTIPITSSLAAFIYWVLRWALKF